MCSEEKIKNEIAEVLKKSEGRMTMEMYRELLIETYKVVSDLKEVLDTFKSDRINLMDTIAAKFYTFLMDSSHPPERAMDDAYRAADILIKVKESKKVFEGDLIDILKKIRDTSETDEELGKNVKLFLNNR